jgi:hypothetical protein
MSQRSVRLVAAMALCLTSSTGRAADWQAGADAQWAQTLAGPKRRARVIALAASRCASRGACCLRWTGTPEIRPAQARGALRVYGHRAGPRLIYATVTPDRLPSTRLVGHVTRASSRWRHQGEVTFRS